jgi:hypothetical protein|nr:MAG TPA: hypothetical protein [Caudoviricetes sp.]
MEIAQIVQTVKCPNGATVLVAGNFLPKNDAERQERRRAAWAQTYRNAINIEARKEAEKKGETDHAV